ncbi:unnamed protein product, partial [Owenia fusiformis]
MNGRMIVLSAALLYFIHGFGTSTVCVPKARPINSSVTQCSNTQYWDEMNYQCQPCSRCCDFNAVAQDCQDACMAPSMSCYEEDRCKVYCNQPQQPDYGNFMPISVKYDEGNNVTFHCFEGYLLSGKISIECVFTGDGGSWSSEPPTCMKAHHGSNTSTDCVKKPKPPGFQCTDLEYWDGMVFKCEPCSRCCNYTGIAKDCLDACVAPSMTCEVEDRCKVYCDPPTMPEFGTYVPMDYKYGEGDIVTFQCNAGYSLSENISVLCSANGAWSPSPPSCVKDPFRSWIVGIIVASLVIVLVGIVGTVLWYRHFQCYNNIIRCKKRRHDPPQYQQLPPDVSTGEQEYDNVEMNPNNNAIANNQQDSRDTRNETTVTQEQKDTCIDIVTPNDSGITQPESSESRNDSTGTQDNGEKTTPEKNNDGAITKRDNNDTEKQSVNERASRKEEEGKDSEKHAPVHWELIFHDIILDEANFKKLGTYFEFEDGELSNIQ